jgi:hypothetical protein
MHPPPDLPTILSQTTRFLQEAQHLRPLLVPLLAELPLPHSTEVKDLHAAVDKAIRAAELVQNHSRNWEHLLGSRRRA